MINLLLLIGGMGNLGIGGYLILYYLEHRETQSLVTGIYGLVFGSFLIAAVYV